jgi:hypothetical protein
VNFAFRGICNRCGAAQPAGAGGGSGGRGRDCENGAGSGCDCAGTGPTGLFGPNDWPCLMQSSLNFHLTFFLLALTMKIFMSAI